MLYPGRSHDLLSILILWSPKQTWPLNYEGIALIWECESWLFGPDRHRYPVFTYGGIHVDSGSRNNGSERVSAPSFQLPFSLSKLALNMSSSVTGLGPLGTLPVLASVISGTMHCLAYLQRTR